MTVVFPFVVSEDLEVTCGITMAVGIGKPSIVVVVVKGGGFQSGVIVMRISVVLVTSSRVVVGCVRVTGVASGEIGIG